MKSKQSTEMSGQPGTDTLMRGSETRLLRINLHKMLNFAPQTPDNPSDLMK